MIQIKELHIKTKHSWGFGEFTYEYYGITKTERDTIIKWLENNQTSFNGFSGKVYFMKDVTFPRYKFTDYGRNNNNVVQTTRTSAYADAVVINIKEWINELNNKLSTNVLQWIGVTVAEKNEYIKFPEGTDLTSAPNLEEYAYRNLYSKQSLEIIVQAYNEFAGTKIINVLDLNSVINNQNGPITADVAENLTQLLKSSDKETVKLGMEMLTNYDLEASLLHLYLISSQVGDNIRYNDYWSSVNFKAFREKFRQTAGTYFENYSNNNIDHIICDFLTNEKALILEEDLNYINSIISEQIKSTFTEEINGFVITDFKFKLNIKESQIIRKPQVIEEPVAESTEIINS